jgi:hypothetical protein
MRDTLPPKPHRMHEQVCSLAAREIIDGLPERFRPAPALRAAAIAIVFDHLRRGDSDGYALCYALEQMGVVHGSTKLTLALDQLALTALDLHHDGEVKHWLDTYNPTPEELALYERQISFGRL